MRCVRIWFSKTGRARYISHLDLMRCMSRLMRRAGIPLWYTQGFNPQPYMTFSLPLSLGMESVCESLDIRIEGDMSDSEIMKRLNENMPEGLYVTGIAEPLMKTNMISLGDYLLKFCSEDLTALTGEINALLSSEELIALKMSGKGRKKSEKRINLIEHIKSFEINTEENALQLGVILSAGNTVNINPSLVSGVIEEKSAVRCECTGILRRRLLTAEMLDFK